MKQKVIQIGAMGLVAMMSISAYAADQNGQNDQDATKGVIALAAGAVAGAGPAAGTVHFYKKANQAALKGMSLEAFNNKKLRSELLKEEEAAASKYTRGMVLTVISIPTGILTAMNLMGLKQSDEKVSQQVEKAKATQQGTGGGTQIQVSQTSNSAAN